MPFRLLAIGLLLSSSALAQIWPPKWGDFDRTGSTPAAGVDRALASEFGLQASETAVYRKGSSEFRASAWRLSDPTGAMALFLAIRPAEARAAKTTWTATSSEGTWFLAGNHVFLSSPNAPADFRKFAESLPGISRGSLPVLLSYLPEKNRVANTDRYILGPAALQQFESRIPADAVRFDLSPEGYLGRFRTSGGEVTIAIFSYPTPGMARDQLPAFEKVPGAVVKRSGPLVAVAMGGSPDAAQALLADFNYELALTENYEKPLMLSVQDWMKILLAISELIGVLLIFGTAAGLLFGIGRAIKTRLWPGEYFTSLHLNDPVPGESPRE